MFKNILALTLCAVSALAFCACRGPDVGADKGEDGKIKVAATFNAMKEFAEAVGGDRAKVLTIIPDGTEPHDFEPKTRDLVNLNSARIFIYNGLGMEAWAAKASAAAGNNGLIMVNASEGAELIKTAGENGGGRGEYDPHVWLSLKCAETIVENIKDAFIKADPENAKYYEDNCSGYISRLEGLYNEYAEKFGALASGGKNGIVTGHAAFAYLCRDFGLEQISVEDVYAEGEPSMRQLTDLVEYCKIHGIKTVFAEEMASPEVSRTLAGEVGAKVETIYTIESSDGGLSYLERMESNIKKIYDSLAQK